MKPYRSRNGSRKATTDELFGELRQTVEGLAADGIDRGDLKILLRMRNVGHERVLRLRRPLQGHTLHGLKESFGDILSSGTFRACAALPEEGDEPELAALPRLAFHFNRRSFGRLRMLIDALNREGEGVPG